MSMASARTRVQARFRGALPYCPASTGDQRAEGGWVDLDVRKKGAQGEAMVARGELLTLPPSRYTRLNDVTLRARGGTTQIDHVFVSRFGVFVIETKNMSGRIYGRPDERFWTQYFPSRSFAFPNPLRQNDYHVEAVEKVLGDLRLRARGYVHSVVAFVGDAELRKRMPSEVTTGPGGWATYISSFRRQVMSDTHVRRACSAIRSVGMPSMRANGVRDFPSAAGPAKASRRAVASAEDTGVNTNPRARPANRPSGVGMSARTGAPAPARAIPAPEPSRADARRYCRLRPYKRRLTGVTMD